MAETSETRLVGRICLLMRAGVISGWLAVLIMVSLRGIHPYAARGVFSFFKIVAILASLWLIAEIAEAFAGRASFRSVMIDAILTLPMFVFWFLVFVSTF